MQSQLGKKIKTRNRNPVERNRQEHSTRDRNKKRHGLLVQKHTTQSHVPKGITTTTRTIRCTSCGRSHEDWNHFWKCPKYKPIWKKLINLMNEREIAEESGKTHDYTQEWVYLGIRKDGKALNRGHALMHMIT